MMTRLHWFWRAIVAAMLGMITGMCFGDRWVRLFSGTSRVDDYIDSILGRNLTDPFLQAVLMVLVAAGAFVLLTYVPSPENRCGETRCRKCGYILRGLTEPRCPECGERI